ncbi:MAG: hypothetical protein H8E40_06725 [Chloroflexi bacterium]|nr:hypothetical protein [Chloroflexota bacterium]
MPRISLAKQYYEETETDDETGFWLILYDFKGIKPSTKFWTNLKRIQASRSRDAYPVQRLHNRQQKRSNHRSKTGETLRRTGKTVQSRRSQPFITLSSAI